MINSKILTGGFLIAIGLSLGFGIGSLRAAGVPQDKPLYYSGTLIEAGELVTANRNIRVSLWKSESSTDADADRLCETVANNAPVEGGRFRVALNAACVDAVHSDPELWVEVLVGSTIIGSRAKLGAVPYALEADRASNAGGALEARLAALEAASPAVKSAFRARATTAQTVLHNDTTQVYFATEEFDLGDEFNPTTSVFTAKTAGVYEFGCSINFGIAAAGSSGYWEAGIYLNGERVINDGFMSDGRYTMRVARGVLELAVDDEVACSTFQDSGSDRPINVSDRLNTFEAVRLLTVTP